MKTLKPPFLTITVKFAFLVFLAVTISSCKPIYKGKPVNAISVERAKELNNNFNKRHDSISRFIGKPDNRSSWHSLEELEQYIAYIKVEGAKKDLDVDGIRIYFGAYGLKDEGRENYSTLFLVPTVKGSANTIPGVKNFAAVGSDSGDTQELSPLNFGELGNPPNNKYK